MDERNYRHGMFDDVSDIFLCLVYFTRRITYVARKQIQRIKFRGSRSIFERLSWAIELYTRCQLWSLVFNFIWTDRGANLVCSFLSVCLSLVIGTSAVNCLERLVTNLHFISWAGMSRVHFLWPNLTTPTNHKQHSDPAQPNRLIMVPKVEFSKYTTVLTSSLLLTFHSKV